MATTRGAAPVARRALPEAQTEMTVDDALEVAGVDRAEMVLLAATTFKEARTLEELATLIATTRRRGLDAMLKHVYYERFGGETGGPSLHVGIDGLRAIAAHTGRYGGAQEARFSGTWDMPTDDRGGSMPGPEKATVVVWGIVQGRSCAFEGTAYMQESYPGAGPRGRMWRQRPRSMLSIAAERQALRRAFPAEMAGLADAPEPIEFEEPDVRTTPQPPRRSIEENAAMHARIFDQDDVVEARPKRERPLEDLVARYRERLEHAVADGHIPAEDRDQWELRPDVTRDVVLDKGMKLLDLEQLAATRPPEVTTRSALGQKLADLVEEAARLELAFDDCKVGLPAPQEQVVRAIEKLEERIDAKKRQLAGFDSQDDPSAQQALV
jgi:hypothetical protein